MSLPKDLHLLAKEQPLSSEWIFADNIMQGIIKSRPNKKLLKWIKLTLSQKAHFPILIGNPIFL